MELKKLTIHGFKSFADKVEIVFEKGITGVVGPNGCGKSNIGEAVKWVLGEQNPRLLRGSKMEDVIFNGTEKRHRLSYCEVTLVFDNSDGALPIDFAEVSVTRRVYRNGDGEYKINGSACRLKDVVDLFRDTGLGRDGYSIIGQGMIDDILSQKSEDRRQVFEEAAGIRKIKTRRMEAGKKLENTTTNIERLDDIIGELTDRIEPLKNQSEQARRYISLRDELKTLELNVFLVRYVKYENRLNELSGEIAAGRRDVDAFEKELQEVTNERDCTQNELDELEEKSAELRENVQALIIKSEQAEANNTLLNEKINTAKRIKLRADEDMAAASGDSKALSERIEALGKEKETLKAETEASQKHLAESEKTLNDSIQTLSQTEEKVEKLKQSLINAMNRESDMRTKKTRLTTLKGTLGEQTARLKEQSEQLKTSLGSLESHVNELVDAFKKEKQALNEIYLESQRLNQNVSDRENEKNELSAAIQKAAGDQKASETRLNMLRELQKDYDGYYNSVKQVLRRFRPGENNGVHGIVADIITTPKEIERAIETALGSSVQNIVVDRDEDAKKIIEYLRVNRLGRATFLPISSVHGRVMANSDRKLLSVKGCMGLASELVTYESKYKDIINSLLGYTIVVDNMDTGIYIRRNGGAFYKIVTVQGDVLNAGGSITGGSMQSYTSNLLSRTREISEEEAKLNAISAKLKENVKALSDTEALLKEAREAYSEKRGVLHEQEINVERARGEAKAAEDEKASLTERIEEIDMNIRRLELQDADISSQLEIAESDSGEETQGTENLRKEINEVQNGLYAMRKEVEDMRSAYTRESIEHGGLVNRFEEASKDLKDFTSRLDDLGKLYSESKVKAEEAEASLRELNIQALDAGNQGEEAKKELDSVRNEFTGHENRRSDVMKKLRALNIRNDEIRSQADTANEALNKALMQQQKAETEQKQLTDRIFEDYELTFAGAEQYRTPDFALTESEKRVSVIKSEIRRMGTVNVAAIDEYRTTNERLTEYTAQREDLANAIDDIKKVISELEGSMKKQFIERFALMSEYFKKMFISLFGGGTAFLKLNDENDPLNCGIDIIAQPPGKKLQSLTLLSGGERALTAVAILFAMLELKPTPFCILDEIEAALDDANIDSFAEFLKKYSERTQFVVVTHRKGTMTSCNSLYGVVMEEKGVSKVVSVTLRDAIKEA